MLSARQSATGTIRNGTAVTTAARPAAPAAAIVPPWQPLLTGGLRDRALQAIDALGQEMGTDRGPVRKPPPRWRPARPGWPCTTP